MKYNIGLDLGTSSVKVLAVNQKGKTLALAKGDYATLSPQTGYKEQDPKVIFRVCLETLAKILTQIGKEPQSIGLSCAMHSLIALDKTGRPLTNAILWSDTRCRELARSLRNSTEGKMLYEQSGTPIHAFSPLLKIRWLKEFQPDIFEKAAYFADIKTYLLFQLFGEMIMDYSMAGSTGLFNLQTFQWNPDSLAYAGIKTDRLPQLVDTSFIFRNLKPAIARQLNISPNISWIVGASDGCTANLGAFAFAPQRLIITVGTSAALRFTSPRPLSEWEGQLFCYYLEEDKFICGGASNNGGLALRWLQEQFFPNESFDKMLEAAAAATATAEGLVFLPWLLGERAPIWDSNASGALLGLRDAHQRTHIARAVLEGITFNAYHIFHNIPQDHKNAIQYILTNGGLARSAFWNQMTADVFGLPVKAAEETESSALGAVLLAMKATGQIEDYQEAIHWQKFNRTFEPNAQTHLQYRQFDAIISGLYSQLKATFESLADYNQKNAHSATQP